MSKLYRVIIRGGEPITVNEKQADTISLAMLAGDNGRVIKLKDQDLTVRVGDCRRVERDHAAELEADTKRRQAVQQELLKRKALETPVNRCRGTKSIQREIHQIIVAEFPKDWPRMVRNQTLRATIRDDLLSKRDDWCDYKAGRCVCPPVGQHELAGAAK